MTTEKQKINNRIWSEIRTEERNKNLCKIPTNSQKSRAFAMFAEGYEIKVAAKAVGVHHHTACEWYGHWLKTLKHKSVDFYIPKKSTAYWINEEEIEKSLNLNYTFEDLSDEEKRIYNEST